MKICRWIKDERIHGFKLKGKLRYLTKGKDLNEKRKDSKKHKTFVTDSFYKSFSLYHGKAVSVTVTVTIGRI